MGITSLYRRWEWNQYDNDGPRTNNHNEAYNGKLSNIINSSNPYILEFVMKIKSEETHYKLAYFRLANNVIQRGFAFRKRSNADIQKDLDLSNIKKRYMKKEFDVIEFNRRCAYHCHEYGDNKNLINKNFFFFIGGYLFYFILLY